MQRPETEGDAVIFKYLLTEIPCAVSLIISNILHLKLYINETGIYFVIQYI
jgi:hypothetical protein